MVDARRMLNAIQAESRYWNNLNLERFLNAINVEQGIGRQILVEIDNWIESEITNLTRKSTKFAANNYCQILSFCGKHVLFSYLQPLIS